MIPVRENSEVVIIYPDQNIDGTIITILWYDNNSIMIMILMMY